MHPFWIKEFIFFITNLTDPNVWSASVKSQLQLVKNNKMMMNINNNMHQIFSTEENQISELVIAKPILIYVGYGPKYTYPVEQKQTKWHQIHRIS